MFATFTWIAAIIAFIAALVQIFKDGPSVVRRALGLPERVDPAAVATARAHGAPAPIGGTASGPDIGRFARGVALGGMSAALMAEVLAHHGDHAHDVATAASELVNSADVAIAGDLAGLADLPADALAGVLGGLSDMLNS